MYSDAINENELNFKKFLFRIFTFWPYFLIFIIFCVSLALVYLRYAEYQYTATAKIQIIDKAQDSEMALPTSMTIFNRSMINLQNEIGVLSSYSLNERVIKKLNFNVKFFTLGRIKKTQNHQSEFFEDYDFELKSNYDFNADKLTYNLNINSGNLKIISIDENNDLVESFDFIGLSTLSKEHTLPFEISIRAENLIVPISEQQERTIEINNLSRTVNEYISNTKISVYGEESDQLEIVITNPNKLIAEDFLNTLIYEFDLDGITDRQLEYKRTMDFVDTRAIFLENELELIENRKKEFKEKNKLTDVRVDADISISQQLIYDSELFNAESQKELLSIIKADLKSNSFKLLPVNVGLDDSNLNLLIEQYNTIVKERERFLNTGAGEKNAYILSLNNQIESLFINILKSIESYDLNLSYTINNFKQKELEFENIYMNIPQNEKVLRSINRELEVKESLFLLLLQKREEAAINNAVVKPSIKIIDYAISSGKPVSPSFVLVVSTAIFFGFLLPILFLSIWFFFDDKIHVRDDILERTNEIPILAEVPFIKQVDNKLNLSEINSSSRSVFVESMRMLIANLNYINSDNLNDNKAKIILVTSSIKGEGKTIVSSTLSQLLSSSNKKVILVGADLRNPQIHNYLNVNKNDHKGISDIIYNTNLNWKDHVLKSDNLDIILSGSIPPNPNELISSEKFQSLISELALTYDYVIIDSAPCILVSDTLQISKLADLTLYLIRSGHSPKSLLDYIIDLQKSNKLNKLSIVLNSVGNSSSYGYGYRYGYQYGYNYGYGYGYKQD